MSMQNRAAQFAPFAALTGYEEAVKETPVNITVTCEEGTTAKTEVVEKDSE